MSDTRARLSAALAARYRIDRELGAVGMATVYLAHDIIHDRDVALKVMRPELSHELSTDRFLREIRTSARLQHPHIVPVFDSGSADGQLFFVMPPVEGESLRARLDRERRRRRRRLALPRARRSKSNDCRARTRVRFGAPRHRKSQQLGSPS